MRYLSALLATTCLMAAGCDGALVQGEDLWPAAPPPIDRGPSSVPAISGGTLTLTPDGATAVVGDPERDAIYIVDIDPQQIRAIIEVQGEPGRVVIDAMGETAYVALRSGGGVAVVDLMDGSLRTAWTTCPAPRGLDVSSDGETLLVACAGGYLVTHRLVDGFVERRVAVAPDLRDVLAFPDHILVTRFRAAELLTLNLDGEIVETRRPPEGLRNRQSPTVAWRLVDVPDGGVAMLHQMSSNVSINIAGPGENPRGGDGPPRSGYSMSPGFCGEAIVGAAMTYFPEHGGAPHTMVAPEAVLAVDLAFDADGGFTFATPGNHNRNLGTTPQRTLDWTMPKFGGLDAGQCLRPASGGAFGSITSVAARPDGRFVAFRREPAALVGGDGQVIVLLPVPSTEDAGHALFHQAPGSNLACASCHPEGSEDGHVWLFDDLGARRTQELRGGISGSAPFHWQQDMDDMYMLLDEVMHGRMGGAEPTRDDADALSTWLDGQHPPRVQAIGGGDPIAGAIIFDEPETGCAWCHAGPRFSDGRAHDVGTGERLETPTLLGIGRRAKLLHNGCAETLEDRFDPRCGGEAHGRVDHLSGPQMRNLLAFLRSL